MNFAAEAIRASQAIDAVFADRFQLTPQMAATDVNAAPTADPTRLAVEFDGIYVDPLANPRDPNAYDTREFRRPQVEATAPMLEISPGELARLEFETGAPFFIGKLDQVKRLNDGATWQVMARTVTASGLIRLKLNRL